MKRGINTLCELWAKVFITGARNVVVSVSQITSARYMLQVCLCAEYKAMRVVFDSCDSTDHIQDWMEKKASESPMFHYWKKIFDLQILNNDVYPIGKRMRLRFVCSSV